MSFTCEGFPSQVLFLGPYEIQGYGLLNRGDWGYLLVRDVLSARTLLHIEKNLKCMKPTEWMMRISV